VAGTTTVSYQLFYLAFNKKISVLSKSIIFSTSIILFLFLCQQALAGTGQAMLQAIIEHVHDIRSKRQCIQLNDL